MQLPLLKIRLFTQFKQLVIFVQDIQPIEQTSHVLLLIKYPYGHLDIHEL
jgi:hypothetical protein